jgi:hypothetical protein
MNTADRMVIVQEDPDLCVYAIAWEEFFSTTTVENPEGEQGFRHFLYVGEGGELADVRKVLPCIKYAVDPGYEDGGNYGEEEDDEERARQMDVTLAEVAVAVYVNKGGPHLGRRTTAGFSFYDRKFARGALAAARRAVGSARVLADLIEPKKGWPAWAHEAVKSGWKPPKEWNPLLAGPKT